MPDRGFNSFASYMIKLSVNETKWSSLLARTLAPILYISIRARKVTGTFEKRAPGRNADWLSETPEVESASSSWLFS